MGFISFHNKLLAAFLFLILFPTIGTVYYSYHEFNDLLRKQVELDAANQLEQVNFNFERQLKVITSTMNSIALDPNVKTLLETPKITERDQLNAAQQMDKKFLEVTTTLLDDTAQIIVQDRNMHIYTYGIPNGSRDVREQLIDQITAKNGYMVWSIQSQTADNSESGFITVGKLLKDENLSDLGVAVIRLPTDELLEILGRQGSSSEQTGFLLSEDGIWGTDLELNKAIYEQLKSSWSAGNNTYEINWNGELYLVSTYSLSIPGWHVVQMIPYTEMYRKVNQMTRWTVLVLSLAMTIFIVLIIGFSSMLSKPIRELRRVMRQVESGRLDVSCEVKSRDEIGLLSRSMNSMLMRLKSHIENEVILNKQKEQAKLEALQSQITPHFLYNTMNTIKWMSVMAGTKDITEMLMSLGHLLNMSIHRGQEIIKFEEELENVRSFLTIQRYRFGESIKVREEINPGSLACMVPKLSLQPLVENVYQHGIFSGRGEGEMIIRTKLASGILLIEVEDSGQGLSQERIDEIHKLLKQPASAHGPRIGLKNVHNRIQLMHGTDCGIQLQKNKGNGHTVVSIKLPVHKEEMVDEDRRD
ncbi:sensor histidine kinase [Paenibacillus sp. LjRoot56]|uniref:sensor histidine kinase n=1 Tax=Paenibacillus sp. LjRoot56 TaxID=3342333 RepID=UPI003ED10F16